MNRLLAVDWGSSSLRAAAIVEGASSSDTGRIGAPGEPIR